MEASILQNMKSSDNVHHISELEEKVSVVGNLSNTELSAKEKRAMMILGLISKILGFDHNVFAIGDLMVIKNIKVESLEVEDTIIDPDIVVLKDTVGEKVYVDRSIINQNGLRTDIEETLDLMDYKFIMANFKQIVKQANLLTKESLEKCEEKLLSVFGNAL